MTPTETFYFDAEGRDVELYDPSVARYWTVVTDDNGDIIKESTGAVFRARPQKRYGVKGKSGNFGHAGRPGEIGGSAPGGGSPEAVNDTDASETKVAAVAQDLPEGAFETMKTSLETSGGWSYHAVTGQVPTHGIALSLWKPLTDRCKPEEFDAKRVEDFFDKNRELLIDPENYIGGWLDKDTNLIEIDVSTITTNRRKANRLAWEHEQKAYYDLDTHEEVITVSPEEYDAQHPNERSVTRREMSEQAKPKDKFIGRPVDKTWQAYRDFVLSFVRALRPDYVSTETDEHWKEAAAKFWGDQLETKPE